MGYIEILATIFAILILIKLAFILLSPKTWINLTEVILKNAAVSMIIYLVLAVIVGYYVFNSGISIVQVAAVMMFTSLLFGLGFFAHAKSLMRLRREIIYGKGKAWLAILIWLIIAVWTLWVVFS